jgi:isopenicillin N synthase-like dioxygenase
LQVVYFHAGSKLSYRKVQSNSGDKGSFTSIPVIDVSQMDLASLDERKSIARKLYDSCSKSGFFYITGHGVCPAINPPLRAH